MRDDQVSPVGSPAPAFTLADANGDEVTLATFLAAGPVVLYFLRAFG